jgi:membrane-associated phospholipid phosphatase
MNNVQPSARPFSPRWRLTAVAAIVVAFAPTSSYAAHEKTWATASDIGAAGLAAVALGLPAIHSDKQGAFQAAGSIAAATLVTTGLKEAFPERRPDGSDRKSFPSGHTSLSFAAAASLYQRDGATIGIPAFAVASFVGVARVKADKHFYYDCLVGAGIGTLAGVLITHHRPNQNVALIPWGDTKGGGLAFAMHF